MFCEITISGHNKNDEKRKKRRFITNDLRTKIHIFLFSGERVFLTHFVSSNLKISYLCRFKKSHIKTS